MGDDAGPLLGRHLEHHRRVEVGVRVDKAGHGELAGAVDGNRGGRRLEVGTDTCDLPAFDQDVGVRARRLAGAVDEGDVADDQHVCAGLGLRLRRHARGAGDERHGKREPARDLAWQRSPLGHFTSD